MHFRITLFFFFKSMLGIGNFDILLMVKWKIIKVAWKATNAYVKVKLRLFERILAKVRYFLESAIFLRLLLPV